MNKKNDSKKLNNSLDKLFGNVTSISNTQIYNNDINNTYIGDDITSGNIWIDPYTTNQPIWIDPNFNQPYQIDDYYNKRDKKFSLIYVSIEEAIKYHGIERILEYFGDDFLENFLKD